MKGQLSPRSRRLLVETAAQEEDRARVARERAKTCDAVSARGGGIPSEILEASTLRTAAYWHDRTARLIKSAAPELFRP